MKTLLAAILTSFALIAALSITLDARATAGSEIKVETSHGPVIGTVIDDLAIFKGIPYGAANSGQGRFAPPKDPEPWTEPLQALDFDPSCWQATSDANPFSLPTGSKLSEDCLSLNVWAPKSASKDGDLPVYVFIHGGGFGLGSSAQSFYDGAALAKEGLVVVTINYRLGALGFLAVKHNPNSIGSIGNWGILDQIKALEWVRDNVKAFGGDPQKVTIGGESAGSMSVGALIVSPLAKNLFKGAIMESGSVLSLQSFPVGYGQIDSSTGQGSLLLAALRLKDDPEGLAALREFDPATLSVLTFFNPDWTALSPFSLAPVQDGKVIPEDPQAAMASGALSPVKLLIGFNADEATLFTLNLKDAATARTMIASYLGPSVQERLWALYKPASDKEEISLARQALAMGLFSAGAKRAADLHSRHADVYMYRFSYVAKVGRDNSLGAFHASELPFVFGHVKESGLTSEAERRLSDDMRLRWVSFIKTGDPNQGSKPPTALSWPVYDPAKPLVLRFDSTLSVGLPPELEDLDVAAQLLYGDLPPTQ